MYFNPQVKERREDFFNFEALQEELKSAIENKVIPLIAVSGLRRTGKTSLIKVVLNSLGKKHIWVDSRSVSSRDDFGRQLLEKARELKLFKMGRVSFKGIEIAMNLSKEGLEYLNKRKAILVVDEAQLLKKMRLDNVVAYIYDNYPQIKIILSGSESGMLMNFLGGKNARAPLYGRAVFEIKSHRLEKESSYQYLREGARQAKIAFEREEIRDAVEKLDGIIGWLTKYGWYRLRLKHKEALRKTIGEGSVIAKDEFLRFASRSELKYLAIIRAIRGGSGWSEIKKETAISDKQLYSMLQRMIDYGFILKVDRAYFIADPLLEAAV